MEVFKFKRKNGSVYYARKRDYPNLDYKDFELVEMTEGEYNRIPATNASYEFFNQGKDV